MSNIRNTKGANSPNWRGGRQACKGYIRILAPDHPRANRRGYVFEHVIVAEEALGRFLPRGHVVHHINGVKSDNRKNNLVICQDNAYHTHLHTRQKAFRATGRTDLRHCCTCKEWKPLGSYRKISGQERDHHCPTCRAIARKEWRLKNVDYLKILKREWKRKHRNQISQLRLFLAALSLLLSSLKSRIKS